MIKTTETKTINYIRKAYRQSGNLDQLIIDLAWILPRFYPTVYSTIEDTLKVRISPKLIYGKRYITMHSLIAMVEAVAGIDYNKANKAVWKHVYRENLEEKLEKFCNGHSSSICGGSTSTRYIRYNH